MILFFITKSNFGGAQKYVFEAAQKLKKQEEEVAVMAGGNGILFEKLKKENIPTYKIESLRRNINLIKELQSFFEIIKIIKKIKPRVIYLNSSKSGLAALAARILGVKTVFVIHGWAFNENRNWFSKLIIKKIYLITLLLSQEIIAVSNTTKNQSKKIPWYPIFYKKIRVEEINIMPINFVEKNEARQFILEKINKTECRNLFGTIAELHHIKGINYLIKAAKEIISKNPKTFFVVIGEGEERIKLEKQIKESGISENFFLIGFIDGAAKYLKAFDCFILPSLSEAYALVLKEAEQAKIPIIATKVGGVPEALRNYENKILIEPRNSEMLEKILKIYAKITA